MTCLLNPKDSLYPRNNLMRAGIGGLIQIDNTIFKILFEATLERGGSSRNGSIM
jgi:hypothetical protein